MKAPRTGIPPWSLALLAMMLIQLANALSVPVIAQIGPAGTVSLRMCFGTLFLWAIARPAIRSIRRGDLPVLLGLGAATGIMSAAFFSALARIPLGTAVAIEFLGPLAVAAFFSKRKSMVVWPLLALGGVVLLTEPWRGEVDMIGVGFALLAAAGWGLYIVLTQRIGDRFSGISALSLTIPVAAFVTMFVGLPQTIAGEFTWQVLLVVIGLALLTPVISFGLELLALRRMTHTAFGTLMALEPAFGAILGVLILRQMPSALQVLGVVIVVLAGTGAQRGGARELYADPPDGAPDPPS